MVYFGFGRGQYPDGGASVTGRARQVVAGSISFADLSIEDSYGFPQQGMNEKGLRWGELASGARATETRALFKHTT